MKRLTIKSGDVFGYLTVEREVDAKVYPCGGRSRRILCTCMCGRETTVALSHLVNGHTVSCGCRRTKHGDSHSDLYHKWVGMLSRCHETAGDHARYYFERGITVCDEWAVGYLGFKKWSLDHGYKKGLSLDRIDNDKGYCPDNCRWVTSKDQGRNKRNNRLITVDGVTRPMSYWCERYNTYPQLVNSRISRGWSVKESLLGRVV